MALGVNVQWGYAGLFNVGIMGFAALGGAAALLTSRPPVTGAWAAGGLGILASGVLLAAVVATGIWANRKLSSGLFKTVTMIVIVLGGYLLIRQVYDPAVNAIEAFEKTASKEGLTWIRTALSDPDPAVRFAACVALGNLNDQSSKGAMRQATEDADDKIGRAHV